MQEPIPTQTLTPIVQPFTLQIFLRILEEGIFTNWSRLHFHQTFLFILIAARSIAFSLLAIGLIFPGRKIILDTCVLGRTLHLFTLTIINMLKCEVLSVLIKLLPAILTPFS